MSDNATREIFITGLKDAHAMETQALSIMKPHVKRIENYPEVAARLEQHIAETEGQLTRIEEILSGLDWLDQNLPAITSRFLSLREAGDMAKV